MFDYNISLSQLANGNNTQWLTKPQKTGYLVAIQKYGATLKPTYTGCFSRQQVCEWLYMVLRHFNGDCIEPDFNTVGSTVGSWLNDGILYLDVCRWFADRNEAIAYGREQEQLAIWDIEKQEEITL